MPKNTLPSLEQLIRRRIRRRIVLALLLLVGVVSVQTGLEINKSVSDRIDKLRDRATVLQDLVTSEVLVHNRAAVDAILLDANKEHPNESVHWIPPEEANHNLKEGMEWSFSGRWILMIPLKEWGNQKFGTFVFDGNFLKDHALISALIHGSVYVAFFCIILCATLFPIAKAPNDLILKPMRRLLSLVSNDQENENPSASHDFSEIRDLEIELRSLLAERRLRVEEQIEAEQSKAITQAAQMLAHDIRRPFALVKAALDGMAQARSAESAKKLADKTLPRVNNAFLALDAMLDELMMLGRPQSIPAVRVDMSLIIEQALETSLALYPGSDQRAAVSLEENLFVQGHAGHLQRVLSNLVVNALQIMSPSDTLEVSGRRKDDRIEIRVHNTGSFIPANEQTPIFKLFYTKGKTSGLGLGLAICKRIIASHNGKIHVESSPETGTTFVFSLPVAVGKSLDIPIVEKEQQKRIAARRLLIADDDIFFRESIERTARSLDDGVEIVMTGTAEDAIRLAMTGQFDAIVMDVNFGDDRMDGITAVRHLRGENITSKICVHTNDATQEVLDQALEAGADAFIPKPITTDGLRSALG